MALATVLSNIKIFQLHQGGSVTAASMVPILWLALRRGSKIGLFGAVMYGLVKAVFDPYIVSLPQLLLDYPIAFGLLGVAGFFQNRPFIGVTLGIVGRFVSHFFSGIIFFAIYSPPELDPAVYSAIYNGGYLVVEFLISIYIIYILRRAKMMQIYI